MKRILLFLLLITLYNNTNFAQDIIIIINGTPGNRPLTLNDFKGVPQADADGRTSATVGYSFKDIKVIGDTAFIKSAVVKIEMHSSKSWIKKGGDVYYLLKHEQGHFDVKRLWAIELKKAFENISVPINNLQSKLDAIGSEISKKHLQLDQLYDKETDHSRNKAEQEKWNQFFKDNLPD